MVSTRLLISFRSLVSSAIFPSSSFVSALFRARMEDRSSFSFLRAATMATSSLIFLSIAVNGASTMSAALSFPQASMFPYGRSEVKTPPGLTTISRRTGGINAERKRATARAMSGPLIFHLEDVVGDRSAVRGDHLPRGQDVEVSGTRLEGLGRPLLKPEDVGIAEVPLHLP